MIDLVMPQMGESLAEGTVVRWLKQPGDRVERDDALLEISTDKVDTDVPAPTAGILESILVREGETVAVGARIAVIREDEPARVGGPPPVPAAGASHEAEEPAGHFRSSHAPQVVSFRRAAPGAAALSGAPPAASRSYSPAVLAAARQGKVALESLTGMRGSGRDGRITKADVARFLQGRGAAAAAPPEAVAPMFRVPAEYRYRPADDDRVVPMSPIRRKIAHHMTWSVRISPHASAFVDCDATRLVGAVHQHRERFAERVGAPLSYTAVAAEAVAQTLREFPGFNASVVDETLVLKPRIHLGIAVALGDTDELVVPVVRGADGLSLEGMARAIHDIVTRARNRQLRPEDVQGGTFTLTNPGRFGGVTGTPILNQPQVGIVGLGAIAKRAVVLDGDRIAPRSMMTIALTFDHRAADGMAAFKFLDRLRVRIEAGPTGL